MAVEIERKIVAYTNCDLKQDGDRWDVTLVGFNVRDEEIKRREFQLSDSELQALLASAAL